MKMKKVTQTVTDFSQLNQLSLVQDTLKQHYGYVRDSSYEQIDKEVNRQIDEDIERMKDFRYNKTELIILIRADKFFKENNPFNFKEKYEALKDSSDKMDNKVYQFLNHNYDTTIEFLEKLNGNEQEYYNSLADNVHNEKQYQEDYFEEFKANTHYKSLEIAYETIHKHKLYEDVDDFCCKMQKKLGSNKDDYRKYQYLKRVYNKFVAYFIDSREENVKLIIKKFVNYLKSKIAKRY